MRLSRNFTLEELKCPCCEGKAEDISMELIRNLQKLRDKFGLPLNINSAYRCPTHNASVGGSERSQHLLGRAADIDITKYSGSDKHRLLRFIYSCGSFSGLGIYKTFIHVDVRKDGEVTWIG